MSWPAMMTGFGNAGSTRVAIACLALAAASACSPRTATAADASDPVAASSVARQAEVRPRMLLTGRLEAVESEKIYVPRTNAWQLPIRWMARDGSEVRAGQRVLELDNSQFTGDLSQKELNLSSAHNDLVGKQADVAGEISDKEFQLEQRRIELEKARIEAAVPEELRPRREFQEDQLDLARAEVAYAKALDDVETARAAAESEIEELRIALDRARDEIATAEHAIAALSQTAPRDGILIVAENGDEGRKFQVGDSVSVGQAVMSIPDLDRMQVVASLSDVDDGRIAVGAEARCTVDAYPATTYTGRIREISPIAQEDSPNSLRRSFRVLVELAESDPQRMRPGMSVKVEVLDPRGDEGIAVPRSALDLTAEPPRVLLADGSSAEVRLGPCSAMDCVVVEGVSAGSRVRGGS